jgi:hypothetical protein
MINIPKYREKEIKKLYEVFYDKEQSYDLNYRKKEFYKVLHLCTFKTPILRQVIF